LETCNPTLSEARDNNQYELVARGDDDADLAIDHGYMSHDSTPREKPSNLLGARDRGADAQGYRLLVTRKDHLWIEDLKQGLHVATPSCR